MVIRERESREEHTAAACTLNGKDVARVEKLPKGVLLKNQTSDDKHAQLSLSEDTGVAEIIVILENQERRVPSCSHFTFGDYAPIGSGNWS